MPVRRTGEVMGTVVSVDVRDLEGPDADGAIDDVFEWLHWVDATFSTYRPDSEISQLGRGELSLSQCCVEVQRVMFLCELAKERTLGYFDAMADGVVMDPSGMVKGWSVEHASDLLLSRGSHAHCINAGGDVRARGAPDGDGSWNVGIVHPLDRKALTTFVCGRDFAVATSGTAERGEHIVDPHTHAPATTLASVTVVGPELIWTDAYATAALAMGRDAPAWLETLADHEAYVIDAGGHMWQTKGFEALTRCYASSCE